MPKSFFPWRDGRRAALSLTFDDARLSQVDCGLPILDAAKLKATFYVSPSNLEKRLDGWHRAVANGHEIGNHTMTHPCSGNFSWSRDNALEDYTLRRIEKDILAANAFIKKTLGIRPVTFAYPCGQKIVGRGARARAYVPVVAKHFAAARGYPDEIPNDPRVCDLSQLCAARADGATFEQLRHWIQVAQRMGGWLILTAHETGGDGAQSLAEKTLRRLCRFVQDPSEGIWVDTVAAVAAWVRQHRGRRAGGPV
jgi:peptidoglycan/xylan/chitin deacetylase (PgdA/CDA1 family)